MKEFTFTRTYKSPIEVNIGDTFYCIGLQYFVDKATRCVFRITSVVEEKIFLIRFDDCFNGASVEFECADNNDYKKYMWGFPMRTNEQSFKMLNATVEEWMEWNKKVIEKCQNDVGDAALNDIYDICTMFLYTDREKAQQAVNEINEKARDEYEKIRKDNPDMPMWEDIKWEEQE